MSYKKVALALVALAGIGVIIILVKSNSLNIKQIECFTQFGPCNSNFSHKAQFLIGRPIYLPLPKSQIAQELSGDPAVAEVAVYRRLPDTVVLGVTLRRPVAAVLGSSTEAGQIGVVDDQGMVFNTTDRTGLPIMTVGDDVKVGTKLSPIQISGAKLLARVSSILQIPVKGYIQGTNLVIALPNSGQLILDAATGNLHWEDSLQAIWARSKIDGKIPRKIDLRFSSPAVTF